MDKIIALKDMRVNLSYQRQAKPERVKKIAREWDDMKANLIHVSHRADGFYYIMDGNHTRLAYESIGGKELLCRVYEGLTVEDEARIFSELNMSQKKPSFAELLKSKATAGCELEESYLKLFEETSIAYTLSSTAAHGCMIKCHSALFSVYKLATYPLMLRAMKVAKKAANGREEFYQIGFFPGLCSTVVKHPEIDDARLIDRVQKSTASEIREIADMYKRGKWGSGGNGAATYFRKAYIDICNKGLRKNKITEESGSAARKA